MSVKLALAGEGGMYAQCRPPPLITFTITSKVAVYAPSEWADPVSPLEKYVLCGWAYVAWRACTKSDNLTQTCLKLWLQYSKTIVHKKYINILTPNGYFFRKRAKFSASKSHNLG
jgi:hypothetical protein